VCLCVCVCACVWVRLCILNDCVRSFVDYVILIYLLFHRIVCGVYAPTNLWMLLLNDCLLQQAMEEKYKVCDDGMSRLLVWISNVEGQLANQDRVREDVAELKNQINVIRVCTSLSLRFGYLQAKHECMLNWWNHIVIRPKIASFSAGNYCLVTSEFDSDQQNGAGIIVRQTEQNVSKCERSLFHSSWFQRNETERENLNWNCDQGTW